MNRDASVDGSNPSSSLSFAPLAVCGPVGPRGLFGMLVGFAGLLLLVWPQLFGAALDGYFILGAVLIQLGCLTWSGGSIYAKGRPTGVKPLMAAAVQMLIAGVALTLVGTLTGEWGEIGFSGRSVGALAYLILFGSIVAYSAYTYAVQKLPLSLVTTYSYINPLIALVLGWAALGEPLGWREAAAALIVLLGVALVKTSPKELARLVGYLRGKREGGGAGLESFVAHPERERGEYRAILS